MGLTLAEYRGACALARPWLGTPIPRQLNPHEPTGLACGIYLAVGRSQATGELQVFYVGKADRRPDGDVADRVADHLRDPDRRAFFTRIMVVPLVADVPTREVTKIEGDIARFFGVPMLSKAVPRRR